ncbi:MAG TPA: hypothetical protein PKE56_13265 [Acidimicrobiales bacterium]|nr:hypothetical protein [Acidimicrobiales bacterium]
MTTPARRHRSRSALAVLLGVIAVVAVLASVLGTWARSSIYDSDAVARAVDNALRDPEVIDALATHLTDQLMEAIEVERRVADRLPEDQAVLAPLLTGGVRGLVHDGLVALLGRDGIRQVVVAAAREGHEQLVRVLDTGQLTTAFQTADGTVSVNLLPLMGRGFELVQSTGLLADVEMPELERRGDPAEQIASLEDALDRQLPDDFGQLVVYEGEAVAKAETAVARAQQAMTFFKRSLLVVYVVAVGAAVGSVFLARRRTRALGYLSLGVVAAMVLGRAVIRLAIDAAPGVALNPGARAAIARVVTTLADGLLTAVTVALLLALGAAVLSLLAEREGSLRTALRRQRELVTVGAGGLVVAVLWLAGMSTGALVVAAVAAAAVVAAAPLPERAAASTGSGSA